METGKKSSWKCWEKRKITVVGSLLGEEKLQGEIFVRVGD